MKSQPVSTLLLVAVVSIAPACCEAQNERSSTKSDNPRAMNEVRVSAVWYRRGPNEHEGGTSPMSIRVFPNYSKTASVGVLEEFFGGTGDMWRTATWIAAFNAARVNETTITDHEFLVKVGGHIDGPSAGMLTTVAMLAALRGDPVREDATMTGTINPDGTAGAVGGIPQKLDGAKSNGFRYFGYPVGCRSSRDLNTDRVIDLHARGANIGMEVKQIRDVYEAYEFMTGVRLERPEPLSESEMELSPALRTRVEGWSLRARTNLERRFVRIEAQANDNEFAAQMLGALIDKLEASYAEAQTFQSNSQMVAAYYRYMQGDALARALEAMINVLPSFGTGDPEALVQHLESVQSDCLRNLTVFQLQARGSLGNATLGGRIDAINNMNQFAEARAYFDMAEEAQREFVALVRQRDQLMTADNEEAYIQRMTIKFVYACLFYETANGGVEFADDWLSVDSRLGGKVDVEPARYEALARAYASAGASCLSYFDALITEPKAEAQGVSVAAMQEQLSFSDTRYPFARTMALYSEISDRIFEFDNPLEGSLFKLGAGAEAYLSSAGIVNKYYSLEATFEDDGSVKINNKQIVGLMFDRARQRTLEVAGSMKRRNGFVPDSVKMSFQLASALREGSDEDKLEGLNAYWHAAYLCDLANAMTKAEGSE